MQQLTEKFLKSLKPPGSGQKIIFDAAGPRGFGIRLTSNGTLAFILDYRLLGRQRRYTIGQHPDWSLEAARAEARELRVNVDKGEDPLERRESVRDEPLVSDLADDYLERHARPHKRSSTLRNDEQMLNRIILPRLGKLRVGAVGQRDVAQIECSRWLSICSPSQFSGDGGPTIRHVASRASTKTSARLGSERIN